MNTTMGMKMRSRRRWALASAMIVVAPVGLATVPANAGPTKLPAVTGLRLAVTKPADSSRIFARWDPSPRATGYRASLFDQGGVRVARAVSTDNRWTFDSSLPAASVVRVKVVPLARKRPGHAATADATLPDVTAPTGTFTMAKDGNVVTVTQLSLEDDVTPAAQITRTVDWGDGTTEEWVTDEMRHTYANSGVYYPSITLTDQAGNSRVVQQKTVVVGDHTAPRGTFTVSTPTAWAGFTRVEITQSSVEDDFSQPANVTKVVNWNDGTAPAPWPSGTRLRHRYSTPGTYTPTVELTDEAGNTGVGTVQPSTVVRQDASAPTVTLTRPRKPRQVRSWVRLHGTATDPDGSGARSVRVQIVEKRGSAWYGYRSNTRSWVKAGTTKRSALAKSRAKVVRVTSDAWTSRVFGLRKGVLVVRLSSQDNVGNRSQSLGHRQRLTRR